jgi:nucleosome assembly protein 1-like 1
MSGKKGGNRGGGKQGGGGNQGGGKQPPKGNEGGEDQFKFNFNVGADPNKEGAEVAKFDFGGKAGKQALDLMAKDPNLISFMQKKLDSIVGKSSGYFEELPAPVQNRVRALKKLQNKKSELDKEFRKEMLALQEKYDKLSDPLYERRREIVQGVSEPTEEELKEEKKEEGEKKEGESKEEKKEGEKKEEKDIKGIPDFWMETFKHHADFEEIITKKDEAVLKHLIEVRWRPIPKSDKKYSESSFVLEFEFSENHYFENKVLTKSFFPDGA